MNKLMSDEKIKQNLKFSKKIFKQKEVVKKAEQKLIKEKEKLSVFVKECQLVCEHKYEKIFKKNPDYYYDQWPFDKQETILNYFICTKCGHIKYPRKGSEWKICNQCDGDMESDRIIPGQGVRIFVYKCKECGNHTAHT